MLMSLTVNLVLGAGGAAGWVFHAGVLRTLREELAWEASSARLIVGTSAGAAVAAAARGGVDHDDVIHMVRRGPSEEDRAAYLDQVRQQTRTLRPLAPRLVGHALKGGTGVAIAASGMLPPGMFPTYPLGDFPGVDRFAGWPSGLWITAVRVRDGSVFVFGRDSMAVAVRDAVEASSAVPGLFRPKSIDGELFIDGGIASSTHAHLAMHGSPDVVIVSAPLTRPGRRPMAVLARRNLMHERAMLADAGIHVMTVQPPDRARELFRGFPRRNPEAADEIANLAAAATRKAIRSTGMERILT